MFRDASLILWPSRNYENMKKREAMYAEVCIASFLLWEQRCFLREFWKCSEIFENMKKG